MIIIKEEWKWKRNAIRIENKEKNKTAKYCEKKLIINKKEYNNIDNKSNKAMDHKKKGDF